MKVDNYEEIIPHVYLLDKNGLILGGDEDINDFVDDLGSGPTLCRLVRVMFKNCVRLNFFNRSKNTGEKLIWKVINGFSY